MPNPFDQFDEGVSAVEDKNPFDQFDQEPAPSPAAAQLFPSTATIKAPPAPLLPAMGERSTTFGGPPKPLADYAETMSSVQSDVADLPFSRLVAPRVSLTEPRIELPKVPIKPDAGFWTAAGSEVVNALEGLPEFFTSDAGILSLMAGKLAPRLVAAGFAADLTTGAFKQAKQAYQNWGQMTPAEKGKATVDVLASLAMGGLTGAHAAGLRLPAKKTVTETTPPVPPSEIPKTPSETGLLPAVRKVGGEVAVGEAGQTHPEIMKEREIPREDVDQRVFVKQATGEVLDREQAAAETPQIPTATEPERRHSTDLPEAKPETLPAPAAPAAEPEAQPKPPPATRLVKDFSQDELDALVENFYDDADTFAAGGAAREGGRTNYELQDVIDQFAKFAKENGDLTLADAFKQFKSSSSASDRHLRQLGQILKNQGFGPVAKPKAAEPPKPSELPAVRPTILPPTKGPIPPNSAVVHVKDYNGNTTAYVVLPHNGTVEGAVEAARKTFNFAQKSFEWKSEMYNVNTQIGATDASGKLKWVISPNFKHVAEAGTKEARYILGDLSARTEPEAIPEKTTTPSPPPTAPKAVTEAGTKPEVVPVRRAGKPSFWIRPRPDNVPDILEAIQDAGGLAPLDEKIYGNWRDKVHGIARFLIRKGGRPADLLVDELSGKHMREGQQTGVTQVFRIKSVDDLLEAIDRAVGERESLKQSGGGPDVQADKFWSAASDPKSKSGLVKKNVQDLKVGDRFRLKGKGISHEELVVTHIDPDSGEVTVKDGRTLGIQSLPDGAEIWVQEGTFKTTPTPKGGELFAPEEMPFNLAGEKVEFLKPKVETTGYGEETLQQNELFAIQKVVESKDPAKSADAAQKMYGDKAIEKLQNQLRVVDSDPETKKAFTKSQRQMLGNVIALLRERTKARPTPAAPPPSAAKAVAEPTGIKTSATFERFDNSSGEFQKQPPRMVVVSRSTIPGHKPWRLTVFGGPKDMPVAIGHVQLDNPNIIPKDALVELHDQLGQYVRNLSIEGYTREGDQMVRQAPPSAGPAPETGKGPGTGVGPGSPAAGDFPAAPRQAVAAGARVENAPPPERPNGPVSPQAPALSGISSVLLNARTTAHDAFNEVRLMIQGIAGKSLPRITAANRQVGEQGVRYGASRQAARPLAQSFVSQALEGTNVDPIKFGAALTEDNLRSVRESFRQQASEQTAQGNQEAADQATAAANRVATIIGSRGSPFATEEAYFDFLAQPNVQRAVQQHIQLWREIIDPQYRDAQSLDPDVELPTRGQQTGARVNLKVTFPEDEGVRPVTGTSAPSLTATFKRKSPFAIKAKGTGESYDIDYSSIIANTFERQLEIANKNAFDRMLVESGNAVIGKPGKQVMIGNERGVAFPLRRRIVIRGEEGKTQVFSQAQNIYVKASLAREYEGVSNIRKSYRLPYITRFMNRINNAALAGLTDFTVHTSNLMTALFDRPIAGKTLWRDILLSSANRADVPVALAKAFRKAFQDNQKQIAELSEIGAMRPEMRRGGLLGWSGKLLKNMDRVTRLVLDDTFKSLVEQGLVENTETARREYVNQIGQYNKRLQGPLTALAREMGFGPFVTAGKTFNALGVRMATMSPGAKATSGMAAAALRVSTASKWLGAAALVGTLNYILTKDKGGGVSGRPGTPIGKIDTGLNDQNGRPLSFPLFDVLGLGRGLRVTGIRAAAQSLMWGLTTKDAIDSAGRDIVNSWVSPFAGPPVRFGMIAASGYQPAIKVPRVAPAAAPGQSQLALNTWEAVKQANPVIQSYLKYRANASPAEVMASQLPRFTLSPERPGEMMERYPKIVRLAQTYAFAEDVVGRARRMSPQQRGPFLAESRAKLPPDLLPILDRILKERHITGGGSPYIFIQPQR